MTRIFTCGLVITFLDTCQARDHEQPWTKHAAVSCMKCGVNRMNLYFVYY